MVNTSTLPKWNIALANRCTGYQNWSRRCINLEHVMSTFRVTFSLNNIEQKHDKTLNIIRRFLKKIHRNKNDSFKAFVCDKIAIKHSCSFVNNISISKLVWYRIFLVLVVNALCLCL